MSPVPRNEDGVPRTRTVVTPPPGAVARKESWSGANEQKAEKLSLRRLRRQAGAQGLELRHSDSGYSLIDSARKQVEDRNDMTLKQVESWLKRG